MLFARFAGKVVTYGRLTIIDADGRTHVAGVAEGPAVTIRLRDKALHHSLALNPTLRLAEAYVDGTLTIEDGELYDFVELGAANYRNAKNHPLARGLNWARKALRGLHQHNPAKRSQANVAHHYDLSGELYDLFLDEGREYSCAYFRHDHDDLEQAQRDKKRHLAAKLLLAPGQRVLDIGSGWGGLALYLAETAGCEVVGITLSKEQLEVSRQRAQRAGLADRVRFELRDYREQTGNFDRIVSVGMFEHVGAQHYPKFVAKVAELLTEDGVAVLHSIGRRGGPGATNPWLRKYIFPGGYSPALSEVVPVVEQQGFWITDIEVLRLHYADTLRAWRRRFAARRVQVAKLYDERFCRMWEFYLASSEVTFRRMGHMVFQMQLAKQTGAVPRTRDYIAAWEREHAEADLAAE